MVAVGKGRIYRRKDGKYFIYVPKDLAEDSMFPFRLTETKNSERVKVFFDIGKQQIITEKLRE